jgi:hypothetical protein
VAFVGACVQAQPTEADDPTGGYMLQAGARICKSLGEEFIPYLGIVMPPLLHSAQLKPDIRLTDADSDEDDDNDEDVSARLCLGLQQHWLSFAFLVSGGIQKLSCLHHCAVCLVLVALF